MLVFNSFGRNLKVPIGPQVIDFSNRLAYGLVGAFLPGAMGQTDLTGNIQNTSIGNPDVDLTPEGMGFRNFNSNSPNKAGIFATAPSVYKTSTAFTVYYRGYCVSTASVSNFANLIVVSYDNANSSPFNLWTIACAGSGFASLLAAWNTAGANQSLTLTGSAVSAHTIISVGATFNVGGNVTGYFNGAATNNTTFGAGAPTSTANSQVCFNCGGPGNAADDNQSTGLCGYYWNRELTADEMASIHYSPYQFLLPAEGEMSIMKFAVPPVKPYPPFNLVLS